MSDALKAQGVKLEIDNDGSSPYSYIEVGEVTDLPDIGGGEAADIDVTHLRSTAREYLVGLPDGGSISLSGNLVPDDAGQAEMRTAMDAQTPRHFRITLTDTAPATTVEFDAYVKRFAFSAAVDSKIAFTATLRVTGPVVWNVQ